MSLIEALTRSSPMPRSTRLISTLVLAAIAACQPAPPGPTGTPSAGADTAGADTTQAMGPLELRTDRERYQADDQVGLTFVSHAEATYSFNPCLRTVEREGGGGWEAVEEPDRVCTMEAWLLEPGATRTADTDLPGSLAAGRYRLVVPFTKEDPPPAEHTQAVSAPITIAP